MNRYNCFGRLCQVYLIINGQQSPMYMLYIRYFPKSYAARIATHQIPVRRKHNRKNLHAFYSQNTSAEVRMNRRNNTRKGSNEIGHTQYHTGNARYDTSTITTETFPQLLPFATLGTYVSTVYAFSKNLTRK